MSFLLPPPLVEATLRELREGASRRARRWHAVHRFYTPAEIQQLARDAGFRTVAHVSAAEVSARYFADRNDGLRPPRERRRAARGVDVDAARPDRRRVRRHAPVRLPAPAERPDGAAAPRGGARDAAAASRRRSSARRAPDAGVHARGQVASFRTERAIPLLGIRRGLNSLLPDSIAIREASEAAEDFHPRFSASGKHYRYTLLARADRSPRWRHRAAGTARRRSIATRCGRRRRCWSASTTSPRFARPAAARRPRSAPHRIDRDHGGRRPRARRRARQRILAQHGADHRRDARRGRRRECATVAQVSEILPGRDRTKAGITAPPQGLELVSVRYRRGVSSGRS